MVGVYGIPLFIHILCIFIISEIDVRLWICWHTYIVQAQPQSHPHASWKILIAWKEKVLHIDLVYSSLYIFYEQDITFRAFGASVQTPTCLSLSHPFSLSPLLRWQAAGHGMHASQCWPTSRSWFSTICLLCSVCPLRFSAFENWWCSCC